MEGFERRQGTMQNKEVCLRGMMLKYKQQFQ